MLLSKNQPLRWVSVRSFLLSLILVLGAAHATAQSPAGASDSDWEQLIGSAEAAAAERQFADGIALARQARDVARDAQGEAHPNFLYANNLLASLYAMNGQYSDAEPLFVEILQRVRASSELGTPDVLIAHFNLADLYFRQGRLGVAADNYEAAYSTGLALGPSFRQQALEALAGLAEVDMALGRWDAAQQKYADLLEQAGTSDAVGPLPLIRWSRNRAEALSRSGVHDAAEVLYRDVLADAAENSGPSNPLTLQIQLEFAAALDRAGRRADSAGVYETILQRLQATGSTEGPIGLRVFEALGAISASEGRVAEAEAYYSDWLNAADADPRSRESEIRRARLKMARLYVQSDRDSEAKETYRQILDADPIDAVAGQSIRAAARLELADLLFQTAEFTEAEPLYRDALDRSGRLYGRSDATYRQALTKLAFVTQALGKSEEAMSLHAQLIVTARGHNETCQKTCALHLLAYAALLASDTEEAAPAAAMIIDALLLLEEHKGFTALDTAKLSIAIPGGFPGIIELLERSLFESEQPYQAIQLAQLRVSTTTATPLVDLMSRFPLSGSPSTSQVWNTQTVTVQTLERIHAEISPYLARLQTQDVQLTAAEFERFKDLKASYDRALDSETDAFRTRVEAFSFPVQLEQAARDGLMSAVLPGTVFVSANLLDDRLSIAFVSTEQAVVRSLARDASLERDIENSRLAIFYEGRGFGDFNTIGRLQTLYNAVFEPIRPELFSTAGQTLIIDVDGPLLYVPFAALHDGQSFVANTHQIVMSASPNLSLMNGLDAGETVTRLGETNDPVFRNLFSSLGFESQAFEGPAYDLSSLNRIASQGPSILQIESDIEFNALAPDSSILKSGDDSIPLNDLLVGLGAAGSDIELVALVKGRTLGTLGNGQPGPGGQLGSGEEVELIQRFAADSDIGGVLMSQWTQVLGNNEDLLSAFYRGWAIDGLSPAQALQQAQLSLLADPERQHPYHWAGFSLITAE